MFTVKKSLMNERKLTDKLAKQVNSPIVQCKMNWLFRAKIGKPVRHSKSLTDSDLGEMILLFQEVMEIPSS